MKRSETVILLDVDNTLLDNDRVLEDLRRYLRDRHGRRTEKRFLKILRDLRTRLGYVDYLGALQHYRLEHPRDPSILRLSSFLIDYPFHKRLYPGALRVLRACRRWGPVVILSDGDAVFQPHKVAVSGLWKAAGGKVLIYVHKERMLKDVERRYPARHYVLVDDKARIVEAVKRVWHSRVTTVFVRQGHYAAEALRAGKRPASDAAIDHLRELPGTLAKILPK